MMNPTNIRLPEPTKAALQALPRGTVSRRLIETALTLGETDVRDALWVSRDQRTTECPHVTLLPTPQLDVHAQRIRVKRTELLQAAAEVLVRQLSQ